MPSSPFEPTCLTVNWAPRVSLLLYPENTASVSAADNATVLSLCETLPSPLQDVDVTHINLNDGTCAGMICKSKSALSIQYHPEAGPGPHDADVCFEMYIDMMKAARA